jgi:hypothetical protein
VSARDETPDQCVVALMASIPSLAVDLDIDIAEANE